MDIKKIFEKFYKNLPCLMVILIFCLPMIFWISNKKIEPLAGVTINYKKPKISFKAYNDKTYQRAFENYFNGSLSFNNFEIRLFNTVYYYLFEKSYSSKGIIIIGKNKWLHSQEYIDIYLNNKAIPSIDIIKFSKNLKEIQEYFKANNKIFIVLITPSKAVFCHETIPNRYFIFKKNDNYFANYNLIINQLLKKNINLVDEPTELRKKGMTPFVKGGIHQDDEGRFFAANLLIDEINQNSNKKIEKLTAKKINNENKAYNEDADYAMLLNLLNFPHRYPVKTYILNKNRPSNLNLDFIGGSFCFGIAEILNRANKFKHMNIYNYFIASKYVFNNYNSPTIVEASNPQQNTKNILKSDVIVLEINEEVLMKHLGGNHGALFITQMKKNMN